MTTDVLYADDTLLLSSDRTKLQRHLELVVDEGRRCGLELNGKKTILMRVNNSGMLKEPSGEDIKSCRAHSLLGRAAHKQSVGEGRSDNQAGRGKGAFKALA